MIVLRFEGYIAPGHGCFSKEMRVRGRGGLPQAPEDWPEHVEPGSLNVNITRFPKPLTSVAQLHRYAPAFSIERSQIDGNTLPGAKGNAHAWRATLHHGGTSLPCWVLRRLGSGYNDVLELMSDRHIRRALGLKAADRPTVTVDVKAGG